MNERKQKKIKDLKRKYDLLYNEALVLINRRDKLDARIDKLDDRMDAVMERLTTLELYS